MNSRTNPHSIYHTMSLLLLAVTLSGCLEEEEPQDIVADLPPPATNTVPVISGTPARSVDIGSMYSFSPNASDADGDKLTFLINNMPVWASFDNNTGRLSGQPTLGNVGIHDEIQISVSDGQDSAALAMFSISVDQAPPDNSAPVISGSSATVVTVGDVYSFTPAASDADGDRLVFSIENQPGWTSFNTNSGTLSGQPAAGAVGVYNGIRISVSDGQDSAALAMFSISVSQAPPDNSAPVISGSPATVVTVGDVYSFTPAASDADGDGLVFSIENQPSWASFNMNTGVLSGEPAAGAVGVYSGIRISVSDGQASTSLQQFSITVNAASLASVTVSWTAPTENEDGSPLTDLAGYKIYWGTTSGSYTESVTVNNPGITSYVVDNLSPGTYEFVATSFNAVGMESAYSNPATKVLN